MDMHTILRSMLMLLITIALTGALAIPHICLDDDAAVVTVEQHKKMAKADTDHHQNNSKAGDHCCIAHHCCSAKLLNPAQPISVATFSAKMTVSSPATNHFSSLDPKGLDRPPKFFA